MKCGREPGGKNLGKYDVCPAAIDATFNGFNSGVNAGRICWLVAGTFCMEKAQGSFAKKQVSCKNCDFYIKIHAEESATDFREGTKNIFALTHIGLVRESNEDRYLIKTLIDGSVLVAVADGLGGEVAGDYAAEIMRGKLAGIECLSIGDEPQQLLGLAKKTDLAIRDIIEKDPGLEGMGTTLVCALLREKLAYWVHVGDSRLYTLRNRKLIQITEDQTLSRFLVEEGEITPEQVPTHYSKNILDQCIGCGYCEPETGSLELNDDDLLILSTDGLHKTLTVDKMNCILSSNTDIATKARTLVKAALDHGSRDNITVVIAGV